MTESILRVLVGSTAIGFALAGGTAIAFAIAWLMKRIDEALSAHSIARAIYQEMWAMLKRMNREMKNAD